MFRGFRASPAVRGRVAYEFFWLTRKPMHATFDRRGILSFPALLPQAPPPIVREMKATVAARSTAAVPAHKRIDARRARLACTIRTGGVWLSVEVRGKNHDYAVSKTLNLVNDMFVALHEAYPDYLVQHFGISQE